MCFLRSQGYSSNTAPHSARGPGVMTWHIHPTLTLTVPVPRTLPGQMQALSEGCGQAAENCPREACPCVNQGAQPLVHAPLCHQTHSPNTKSEVKVLRIWGGHHRALNPECRAQCSCTGHSPLKQALHVTALRPQGPRSRCLPYPGLVEDPVWVFWVLLAQVSWFLWKDPQIIKFVSIWSLCSSLCPSVASATQPNSSLGSLCFYNVTVFLFTMVTVMSLRL